MPLISSVSNTGLSLKQTVAPVAPSSVTAALTSKTKVAVSGTLAELTLNLAGLKKNIANISSIKLEGTAAFLDFTGAQLSQYADVISKISDNRSLKATAVDATTLAAVLKNKNVKTFDFSDTAANIGASMGTLIANNSKVTSVAVTGTSYMAISYTNFAKANVASGVFSKIEFCDPIRCKS